MTLVLIDINDICTIIRSMCRSQVQEHLAFPVHYTLNDFDAPLATFLSDTPEKAQLVAEQVCIMFSCGQLVEELAADVSLKDWAEAIYNAWPKKTIVFLTSGSTGEATYQCHPVEYLRQEAQYLSNLFTMGRKRVVASAPSHHIYGFLFTILLPKYAHLPVIFPPIFPTGEYCQQLEVGDLVISFPLFWQALITLDQHLCDDVVGVTSTAPCPKSVLQQVKSINIKGIYNIYGSSETGGLGYQASSEEPFQLMPFWQKSIDEHQQTCVRRECVEGSEIPQDGEENQLHYPPFWKDISIPDHVQWISERKFIVAGRKDKIVQIGGKNVSLEETKKCLLNHSKIATCVVRLMRSDEGNRLKCFVVANDLTHSEKELRQELHLYCRKHLIPAARPKKISFGNELPINEFGKLKDW